MVDDFFTYEVSDRLAAYVYRLIDPRNGETFYVGKGRGNRIFQHALEASFVRDRGSDIMGPKLDRIREIRASGHAVDYVIHRHGMTDEVAFEVEAALIDAYPSLHNAVRGHHANLHGLATAKEIQYRYNVASCELSADDRLLLIKINKIAGGRDPDEIYRLVRFCWKLRKDRAEKASYVLAVDRGIVVGAFVANEWLSATAQNFPDFPYADGSEANRWGFVGVPAPADVVTRYVGTHGKRITNIDLTSQQTIRYWNC